MGAVFDIITGQTGFLAYVFVLLILLLCGLGLPVPEDITLIACGYLSHQDMAVMNLRTAFAVCMFGILAGDTILFFLGRRLGEEWDNSKRLQKLFSPRGMRKARRKFDKHGMKIVFFARFFAGIRAPVFFTAGTLRMRYRTFILLDTAAALLSVPIFLYIGYYFFADIDHALALIKSGKRTGFLILGCIVVAVLAWILIARRLRKRNGFENGKPRADSDPEEESSRKETASSSSASSEEEADPDEGLYSLESLPEERDSGGRRL